MGMTIKCVLTRGAVAMCGGVAVALTPGSTCSSCCLDQKDTQQASCQGAREHVFKTATMS